MQTKKPKPGGKRIMPETRSTEFPALNIDLRVEISRSASDFLPVIGKIVLIITIFLLFLLYFLQLTLYDDHLRTLLEVFLQRVSGV